MDAARGCLARQGKAGGQIRYARGMGQKWQQVVGRQQKQQLGQVVHEQGPWRGVLEGAKQGDWVAKDMFGSVGRQAQAGVGELVGGLYFMSEAVFTTRVTRAALLLDNSFLL